MKQKHLILVPFWIEKVLKRSNLSLTESLNYSKLLGLLSLSDLSAFLKFQNCDNYSITSGENIALLSSWERSCQNDERVELDSTVVPLSCEEEATAYIKESFLANQSAKDTVPFKVVDLDREHYGVVIYPGFTEYILTNSNKVTFIEALLELLYKYFEIHEVSEFPIFKDYLRSMEDSL